MRDAKKTKELIVEKARKVFYDYGYEKGKLFMITNELGLHKSSITYHFGSKANLASVIVVDYINHFTHVISKKMYDNYGFSEIQYISALKYFVFFHALEQDKKLQKFYIEYILENPLNVYNMTSVEHIKKYVQKYNLNMSDNQITFAAISNFSIYSSLIIAYFCGKINVPLEEVIEYKIKILYKLMDLPADFIEKTYIESKQYYENLSFEYEEYFIVK